MKFVVLLILSFNYLCLPFSSTSITMSIFSFKPFIKLQPHNIPHVRNCKSYSNVCSHNTAGKSMMFLALVFLFIAVELVSAVPCYRNDMIDAKGVTIIPKTWTAVPVNAFRDCTNLTEVKWEAPSQVVTGITHSGHAKILQF